MAETEERRNKEGMLLGPKRPDKWIKWRTTRDKKIARAVKAVTPAAKKPAHANDQQLQE